MDNMIFGIIKTSLVDYPGEVSFVIFLGGCNFKCPYCHNSSIVFKENPTYKIDDILLMLKARQKFIRAVVITGGEPTIYKEKLKELIIKIKDLGFKIKIDTNGTNPSIIKDLIDRNLLDYVAMDIKNSFSKYEMTCGTRVNIKSIKKSIQIIEDSNVDYEFRTTLNGTMHTVDDIINIKSYVNNPEKIKFQKYRYSNQQIVDKDFGAFNVDEVFTKS